MCDKFRLVSLIIILMVLICGCTSVRYDDRTGQDVKRLPDLEAEPDQWKEIAQKIQNGGEVVLMAPKGTSLPVKINLDTPVVKLAPAENRINFNRDAYILLSARTPKISPDGKQWVDLNDAEAIKKLFSISNGTLSMGFGRSKKEGVFMTIGMQTQ